MRKVHVCARVRVCLRGHRRSVFRVDAHERLDLVAPVSSVFTCVL